MISERQLHAAVMSCPGAGPLLRLIADGHKQDRPDIADLLGSIADYSDRMKVQLEKSLDAIVELRKSESPRP